MSGGWVQPNRRKSIAVVLALVAALIPFAPIPAQAATFTVNSNGDQPDIDAGDGTCLTSAESCTLRAAIGEANALSGADVINFNIDGSPIITVSGSSLPAIIEQLTIDGTTQPGYVEQPVIELTWGGGDGTAGLGLQVSTHGTLIKGLAITGFGTGVQFDQSGELQNQISDSFIGTANGIAAKPNTFGIRVFSCCNLIGPNNVISGNTSDGILITGSAATGSSVFTNLIGTTASGVAPLGNNAGISLQNGTTGNLINANTIAGNQIGIVVQAPGNRVMDNDIGLDGLGNVSHGVLIDTNDTTVGLLADGLGLPNRIVGNGGNGVMVLTGVRNRISNNVIRDNGGLGIELSNEGVTPNDEGDVDTGPNTLINFPVIGAESGGVAASFDGEVGLGGSTVTIELFSVASCDITGFGEGDTFVTSQSASADDNGDVLVTFPDLGEGIYAATATDTNGNTSEFSQCVTVAANQPPVAVDDLVDAARATDVYIDVVANDTDADDDTLTISGQIDVQPIGAGDALCEFEGTACIFTGGAGFLGSAGFGYQVTDGTDFDNGAVTVQVSEEFTGQGTATIDGVLGGSEWGTADTFDIAVSDGLNAGLGRVYLMNDEENLYFALEVSGISTANPLVEIRFDENGDGIFSDNDDALRLTTGFSDDVQFDLFTDGYYVAEIVDDETTLFNFEADVSQDGGISDGAGASGFSDGVSIFEMSHPMSSGELLDVDLTPGDTVPFQIETFFSSFSVEGEATGNTVVPGDAGTLDWAMVGDGDLSVEAVTLDEDTTLEAGYAVPLDEIPAERLLIGANTIAGTPIGAIGDLAASPMGAIPMAAIPMAAIGGADALGQTLLSEIPIEGGWEALLAGTPYAGRPLQTLTLDEVADVIDPTALAALSLGSLRLGNTGLADLSIASLMLGDVPLSDMCGTSCPTESALEIETSGGSLASVPIGAIPIGAIPMGAIGDLTGAPMGAIPIGAIPIGAIPLGAIGDIEANPLGAIPLGAIGNLAALPTESVPIGAIPMGAIPIGAIPIGAIPIGAIPLGAIPIGAIGGGCAPAGTVDCSFAGVDDTTTVDEYLALTGSADIASSPLGAIALGDLPLGAIPLGAIPIGAIPLGAIPIGAIATSSAPLGAIPIGAIPLVPPSDPCDDPDALSTCTSDTTLKEYAAGYTGTTLEGTPLGAIPIGAVPIGAIPLGAIPIGAIEIAGVPIGAIELNSIDLVNSPIGAIPIGAIPLGAICVSVGSATSLLEAAALGALCDDANLSDLGTALDAFTLADVLDHLTLGFLGQIVELDSLTFGEIVVSILLAIDFPWEDLPLDQIETRDIACDFDPGSRSCTQGDAATPSGLGEPDIIDVDVTITITGGPVVGDAIIVTIPSGWAQIPDSAVLVEDTGEGLIETDIAEPRDDGEGNLTFVLPQTQPGTYTLRFALAPGFELGDSFQVSATSATSEGNTETSSSLSVVEGLEFGDLVGDATGLDPDVLYIGYIQRAADQDWWNVDTPSPGSRVTVYLSNLAGDVDTFVYRPASAPIGGDGSERQIPLPIQPIDDDDVDLSGGGTLSPELLGDSPLLQPPGSTLGDASANRGADDEFAEFFSRDGDSGDQYTIQVAGFQGATSESPYVLRVRYRQEVPTPMCDPRPALGAVGGAAPAIPSNVNTIFLANWDRMTAHYGSAAVAALKTKVEGFAGSTVGGLPVRGVVVPIGSIPGVGAAFAQWDANPCDPAAANAVADLIASYIQGVASTRPTLRHVAIIGGDEVVPFARLEDEAIVANESTYTEGFVDNALYGAHFTRHYLSDAPYGDVDPIPWLDRFAYIRDLGVGRLIESPADVTAAIDTFVANNGLLNPQTMASAGYDFLTDGAQAVESNLAGLTDVDPGDSLINETWTRSDLANIAYGSGGTAAGVISPNAHYDHHRALPAIGNLNQQEGDLFTIADVTGLNDGALATRIIFTMGCHGGLNVDDKATGNDQATDWAQVYGAERAIYIGNTGYGYGDTATVALSEQVMANLAAGLGNGQTIGQNLSQAGQDQFGRAGLYGVYDLKAIEEATLYGLPMWRVSVAGASPITDNGTDTGPVLPDPQTGLLAASFSKSPVFTEVVTPDGTFFAADEGTQFIQWRPITPKTEVDATQPGLVGTGAVLTDLVSRDVALPNAVFARPNTTDQAGREPEVEFENIIFPTTFTTLGTFELLNPARTGNPITRQQSLNLLAGQYVGLNDTQRLFDEMEGQIYYASEGAVIDWSAPRITSVAANVSDDQVGFLVDADDAESGVSRVVVLYRSSVTGGVSEWTALDLIPLGGGTWAGAGSTLIAQPDYIVQAVNGDGVTDIAVFKGDFYEAESIPDVPGVNQPPVVGPITVSPELVQIGTTVAASAPVTDEALGTTIWFWGDGSTSVGTPGSGIISGSHIYSEPGVYQVRLVVVDADGLVGESSFEFVVAFDPEGGYVTGGGWIDSPLGAYALDPTLTGRANFGFVSKYQKGKSTPQGNTSFRFKAAGLDFESTAYEWLVISGSHLAQFKGTGTINGAGNYGFILTAIDAGNTPSTDVDLFRIKIWDKNDGDIIVYDNQMGAADNADPTTPIAGGSIVIHTGKGPK